MIPTVRNVTRQGTEQIDLLSHEFRQRTIRITGEIQDARADEIMAKLSYLDSQSHAPIRVIINSPGGSVTAGLAILDAMRLTESEIETVCTGIAASMAALLAACGGTKGRRYITEHGEMMIHQPLGDISGQVTDIRLASIRMAKMKERLVKLLAEATGKSSRQISADLSRTCWLDAGEAVKYGLADKILRNAGETEENGH